MTISSEKFFRPRKVCVQENISLSEFYQKVQIILKDYKIFVSNKMFAEQWDICKKNSGMINVGFPEPNKIIYGLDYDVLQKNYRIAFCVDAEAKSTKKIQLVFLKMPSVSYKAENRRFQDAVYLERQKEKVLLEKL